MLRVRGVQVFMLVLSILMFAVSLSHAVTVPQLANYTGTLTNSGGSPVPNGNYSIEFRIYSAASGGVALWTEKWDTTTSQVTVVNGVFNVMLGGIDPQSNPIPANFFQDNSTTYLGIKVGTDSEMTPRQRITSVGYALSAYNGVPKGGIIMWKGTIAEIPSGWALCDGTNGTPNLRDRFIVGAGSGYAVGATGGEATHTLTVDEMPSHNHGVTDPKHVHTFLFDNGSGSSTRLTTGGGSTRYTGPGDQTPAATGITINNKGSGAAHENRPPYYALAFIMKM